MDQLANISFFGSILIYGLISSFHCALMCGPFVSLLQSESPSKRIPVLLYHLGRMLSYTFLGLVLGFLGKGANALGELTTIQGIAGIFTFVFLFLFLLRMFVNQTNPKVGRFPNGFSQLLQNLRRKTNQNGLGLGIGFFSALLPCGVLYPAYAASFATGDMITGGVVMFTFYLGTVPMLTGVNFLLGKIRKYIQPKWIPVFGTLLLLTSLGFLLFRLFFHAHGESCDHLIN
ncbi:sulfite exporter TauE/SafE family protein [Leptospira bouyouniensis]|uniref:Sulfite exporter TauE/SafE family protein n=1 Tax=Leptospira bouyouniensis TaxID=2484911 RepID=A0ABY2L541_9LEPT|nr:sulfite exporter TauE/SafE family protein [Leptospira bouyouniensis]TGK49648.1 sulfite exporter TauE/SafE family protein [Leptospira bouyouniensis]TGM77833.1 sulfite exporter TauE/SafE family protein [Leptospira bouyouniensis]